MVETLNKYERTVNWLLAELSSTKDNTLIDEKTRLHLAMLEEAVLYNLSKTEV